MYLVALSWESSLRRPEWVMCIVEDEIFYSTMCHPLLLSPCASWSEISKPYDSKNLYRLFIDWPLNDYNAFGDKGSTRFY